MRNALTLLVIFACASHAQAPQKTGVLREPVQIPLVMNGKQVGMSTVAAGTKVQVVSEADGKVQIAVSGGQVWVATDKVDEVQEAPRVVQSPAPKPASAVSAPPKASAGGDELPKMKTIEERVAQRMAAIKFMKNDLRANKAKYETKYVSHGDQSGREESVATGPFWENQRLESHADQRGDCAVVFVNPETLTESKEVYLTEALLLANKQKGSPGAAPQGWRICMTPSGPWAGHLADSGALLPHPHQVTYPASEPGFLGREGGGALVPPLLLAEGYDIVFNVFVFMAPTPKDADQIVRLAREGATVVVNNSAPRADGLPFEIPGEGTHPVKALLTQQLDKKQVKFDKKDNVVCFTGLAGMTDKQWEENILALNALKPGRCDPHVRGVVDGLTNEFNRALQGLKPMHARKEPSMKENESWTQAYQRELERFERLFIDRKR